MSVPYRAVTWQPYEMVSEEKMNQESSNVQWLFENTPRAKYTTTNINRDIGVKIASGRVFFAKNVKSDRAVETVHFNNFFSANCSPNITTGIISDAQPRIHAVIAGIGGLHPTHSGFRIRIEIGAEKTKNDSIKKAFWVHWMAMGY